MRAIYLLVPLFSLVACEDGDKESGTTDTSDTMPTGGTDTMPTGGTDTGTTPVAIEAVGLGIACDMEVVITPSISGMVAAAVLNGSDYAAAPANNYHEEHNFAITGGKPDALTLALVTDAGMQTQDTSSLFSCAGHYSDTAGAMTYAVRLYDASNALADCEVGTDNAGDDAKAIAAKFASAAGAPPSNPSEFASCGTALTITY